MKTTDEINIENRTYYLYNDIISIETLDSNMLKLDKKTYKNLDIYNIGYVTKKNIGDGYDVNSVNPLYLRINNVNGYIEKKIQINIQHLIQQMKKYLKNIVTFLMEL